MNHKGIFTLVAALLLATPALAKEPINLVPRLEGQDLMLQEGTRTERSTAGVVATNAVYGGLAGAAIGAGIMLIQQDWGGWERTLALSTGIGLLAGAIWGGVAALSLESPTEVEPRPLARPDGAGDLQLRPVGAPGAFSLGTGGRF